MSLTMLLASLIALPFIGIPLLIWFTQQFSADLKLRIIEEAFQPKEVRSAFRGFVATLNKYNFEHLFDAIGQDQMLGLRYYHRVLFNHLEQAWGICVAVCDDEGNLHKQYFEFRTRLSKASSLVTHNCNLIETPINARSRKSVSLPADLSADKIFEIHRHFAKREPLENIDLNSQSALELFRAFFIEDNKDMLDLGAFYYNEPENTYRPTLAGAVLIAWYNMWPFTLFRRIWSNLRFKMLMRQMA